MSGSAAQSGGGQGLLPPNVVAEITGRRVVLRALQAADLDERYLGWVNSPDVNRFLEVRHVRQTMPDLFDYVNSVRRNDGCDVFGVFSRKDERHLGNVSILSLDVHGQGIANYGVMIGDQLARGLGMGADAVVLTVDWIFSHPGVRKIEVGVIAANVSSHTMIRHLGFILEGTLRGHNVLLDGTVSDGLLFGLMRHEWMAVRRRWLSLFGDASAGTNCGTTR